jgi:hypothetical protein
MGTRVMERAATGTDDGTWKAGDDTCTATVTETPRAFSSRTSPSTVTPVAHASSSTCEGQVRKGTGAKASKGAGEGAGAGAGDGAGFGEMMEGVWFDGNVAAVRFRADAPLATALEASPATSSSEDAPDDRRLGRGRYAESGAASAAGTESC